MKEIALFKEGIKRLLKKLHLKLPLNLERVLERQLYKQQELWDISMQELLNSSLIPRQISSTSWK
jgi:hypothetical protein